MHKPHLYLDMDGVQCDFFGAWAAHHQVSSYKEITDPEAAILALGNAGPDGVYSFFRNLKPLPGGQEIIQWLRTHDVPFTVLSAPLRIFGDESIQAKRDWLDEHNPGTSTSALFDANKAKYARSDDKPNVLVDDFGRYIDAWSKAKGIAIHHEDTNTHATIKALELIYNK